MSRCGGGFSEIGKKLGEDTGNLLFGALFCLPGGALYYLGEAIRLYPISSLFIFGVKAIATSLFKFCGLPHFSKKNCRCFILDSAPSDDGSFHLQNHHPYRA